MSHQWQTIEPGTLQCQACRLAVVDRGQGLAHFAECAGKPQFTKPTSPAPRTPAEQRGCLAICATCPHWNFVRCTKCTCPRTDPTAWARRLERGQCPLNLWP